MAPRAPSQSSSPGDAARPVAEPATQAEQIQHLRRQLREKDKLIAVYQQRLASPVFMLKAAAWSVIHLLPYIVRKLRDRQLAKRRARREADVIRRSGLFEEAWYLAQNPEVAQSGEDPVAHYIRQGAAQDLDPGRSFSTRSYLLNYPDIATSGANPLVHYIEHGQAEGRSGESNDYQSWIERFDTLSEADIAVFRGAVDALAHKPLISILMPVYNTEQAWLTRAIDSVRAQLYPHWELCISDDASTLPHVRATLDACARDDARIRVVYRDTNGHISANTNCALKLATGDYVALLDADDELAVHALFWVANEIINNPDADLIYSDEDKIDIEGRRFDAYFKPDWNPALILSQNFFCHLGVYRRSLVEKVGGFRVGFEGSQDHDLLLRCAESSAPERIRHIPRVLYHWRATPGSTASSEALDAKPYAWRAAARAIGEHLQRRGIEGTVGEAIRLYYQVDYRVPAALPKVSIVMPSACKLHLLKPCMESLFGKTRYPEFELLLVVSKIRYQDREQAAYLESLKSNGRIRVLPYDDRPFNYSWLNNWAVSHATGPVLCFMNDDIEVITPDWLEKLVTRLHLDGVGAAGPMLYFPDDRVQHAGVILGLGGVAGHGFLGLKRGSAGYFGRAALEQDLSCVTAACMVVRRADFDGVKGFNEELSVAFNDVDLCIRLRQAGWRILWTPQVEMYHHESASIGQHNSPERKAQFELETAMMRRMWGDKLDSDPFYNPNLSLATNRFTLAFPPRIAKLPEARGPDARVA
jgi:glycosyltransferase involved in cell wall biosynthesis